MLLCTQGSVSLAQKDINYWGPDTTLPAPRHLQTYGDILDYNFKYVDQFMSTDILADRNPNTTRKAEFDGQNLDVVANKDDFYFIRAEMEDARVPYPDEIKSLFDIHKEVEAHYEATGEVIVGVCDYDYEEIKQEAKDNGDIFWDAYQVKFQGGKDPFNMLEQKNTFVMLPLISEVATDGEVTFNFSREHIYTNLDDHIDHIAVDFGDGNGFVNLIFGQSYTVYYPEHGEHELTMMVNYVNRGYKQVKGIFSTRASATIIEVECGGEIPIHNNIQYVELPQAQFDVNVPEVIENKKNDLGIVKARAGIWFGCGDPCVLDKPFIIISGYGPNIGKKNIWSHDPTKNLYSHYNGILGIDAQTSATAGMPNGTNLLYKLRNEGFDIVILEFLNGVDYPQNHAAATMRLIELVNLEKDNNGSMHENILMGQSMGGITSRIALARWEKERMAANSDPFVHHECRTWINWEGEMQGATIPMGIQLYAKYLTDDLPFYLSMVLLQNVMVGGTVNIAAFITDYLVDIHLFYEAINNPAAMSILTYHLEMNGQNNDDQLYRHPLYLSLFAQLEQLGYPEQVRRVAIADGSSTVQRPLGLKRDANGNAINTCLMDFIGFIPYHSTKFRLRVNTGELLQSKTVFRGWLAINGIPVITALKNVKKMYTKAEYDAPGSYERFYKSFVAILADPNPLSCSAKNYRAPFVPTTSVFDVQDDHSLDYGYDILNNLLFTAPGSTDPEFARGYPHNNLQATSSNSNLTPFHSVFANEFNELHNQNPGSDLASFILRETSPQHLFLQNREILGTYPYNSKFEASGSITVGKDVTYESPEGEFVLRNGLVSIIQSPRNLLKTGSLIKSGAHVRIKSTERANNDCIALQSAQQKSNGTFAEFEKTKPKTISDQMVHLTVYPNPGIGVFHIEVSDIFMGGSLKATDITGRTILEQQITSNSIVLRESNLPNMVFLTASTSNKSKTQSVKLIIL
jgi:hypothetical protein